MTHTFYLVSFLVNGLGLSLGLSLPSMATAHLDTCVYVQVSGHARNPCSFSIEFSLKIFFNL